MWLRDTTAKKEGPNKAASGKATSKSLTSTPVSGKTQPGGTLVVTGTPAQDYCYGGNLWVKDEKTGKEDPPVYFGVTCP